MIALVNITSKFRGVEDTTRPPSGLLYLGNSLKKAGYEVTVFHIVENEIDETVEKIINLKPSYVGFSVFTGYPCYTSSIMSKKIKERNSNIPVIWGGIHPSLTPEECLKEKFIDLVVIGEGEETILELSQELLGNHNYENIKGIGYKKAGAIKINPRRELIANLDNYKMDWSLVNINNYIRPGSDNEKTLCFITSRGCPFNCGFCYNEKFNNRKCRAHSIDFVINEVKALKEKTGITRISFDDDHFMVNIKRGFSILSELKKIGITCDWMEFHLDFVTNENMEKLADLGVKRIFFGWESGNNRILKLINKHFTKEIILDKCKILAKFPNINYDASAIIGFPTETWKDVAITIDTALEMAEILPNVNFNLGTYMPYPGTPLYNLTIKEGFNPPTNVEGWKEFDMLEGKVNIDWLPWANIKTKKIFSLIDAYAKCLDVPKKMSEKKSMFKRTGKLFLYFLAKWRLKRKFFLFPFEIYFYALWMKKSIARNIKKFKTSNN